MPNKKKSNVGDVASLGKKSEIPIAEKIFIVLVGLMVLWDAYFEFPTAVMHFQHKDFQLFFSGMFLELCFCISRISYLHLTAQDI